MNRWQCATVACLFLMGCARGSFTKPSLQFAPDLSGPAVPWTGRDFGDGGRDFHFAVVSDRAGGRRPGVFAEAMDKLNLLQPEFVICVGDLIDGYTKDASELRRQQDEFDAIVRRLDMPFFYVSGNHDISNELMASAYRERYGRPYYHFLYKGALFLVLCTEDPPATKISDEQIAYIRSVLAANPSPRWTFLFMHKPIFITEGDQATNPSWARIEPMLAGRKHTIFAGHNHQYAVYERDGNKYIRLATTGGASDLLGKEFGTFDHVVWVTVTPDGPRIANLMLDGIHDEYVSTPEQTARSYELLKGVRLATETPLATLGPVEPTQTTLTFSNATDVPASITAVFQPDGGLMPTPPSMRLRLPPDSEQAVEVTLKPAEGLELEDAKPLTLTYTVSYELDDGTSREFDFSRRIGIVELRTLLPFDRKITVDGQLDDWLPLGAAVEPAKIEGDLAGYLGPNDCRFAFAVSQDGEYLHIAVKVTDDNVYLSYDSQPDDQDAVEILLGGDPDLAGSTDTKRTYGITMCPWKDPPTPNVNTSGTKLRNTKRAAIRTPRGYTVELGVPLAELEKLTGGPSRDIRINIIVRDCDVPGKIARLYWQADWWSDQAVYGSGMFHLAEGEPATQPEATTAPAAATKPAETLPR